MTPSLRFFLPGISLRLHLPFDMNFVNSAAAHFSFLHLRARRRLVCPMGILAFAVMAQAADVTWDGGDGVNNAGCIKGPKWIGDLAPNPGDALFCATPQILSMVSRGWRTRTILARPLTLTNAGNSYAGATAISGGVLSLETMGAPIRAWQDGASATRCAMSPGAPFFGFFPRALRFTLSL